MNDIVGILCLLQRAFKGFYKVMRELPYKPYSVGQKDLLPVL